MNNKIIIGIIVLAIILLGFLVVSKNTGKTTQPQKQKQATGVSPTQKEVKKTANAVKIKGFAFNPETLTVKKGTTVTWTNEDASGHTATADDGTFDTGLFAKGESGNVTFDTVGTFSYHCTPHPNMKGTVTVTE